METFQLAFVSGVIGALIMSGKGRSKLVGFLVGGLLPVLGVIILLFQKSKNSPMPQFPASDNFVQPGFTVEMKTEVRTEPSEIREVAVESSHQSVFIPGNGYFNQEVAGESKYYSNIKRLIRAWGGDGEYRVRACLMQEPSNQFDPNAIQVIIGDATVGYIPKDETEDFNPLLTHLSDQGLLAEFDARVWAGVSSWSDEWASSVSLDCSFDLSTAVAVNSLPTDARIWPAGSKIQVTGEAEHLAEINSTLVKAYVPGICSAYVALQASANEKGKWVIEVYLEDALVGQLSPTQSNKYGPHVAAVSEKGKCWVRAIIKGNVVASEIVLEFKAPELLADDELRSLGLTM